MSMEYIFPSLIIVAVKNMVDSDIMEEILEKMVVLKEYQFIIGFHQWV